MMISFIVIFSLSQILGVRFMNSRIHSISNNFVLLILYTHFHHDCLILILSTDFINTSFALYYMHSNLRSLYFSQSHIRFTPIFFIIISFLFIFLCFAPYPSQQTLFCILTFRMIFLYISQVTYYQISFFCCSLMSQLSPMLGITKVRMDGRMVKKNLLFLSLTKA